MSYKRITHFLLILALASPLIGQAENGKHTQKDAELNITLNISLDAWGNPNNKMKKRVLLA